MHGQTKMSLHAKKATIVSVFENEVVMRPHHRLPVRDQSPVGRQRHAHIHQTFMSASAEIEPFLSVGAGTGCLSASGRGRVESAGTRTGSEVECRVDGGR
jgi:hypothetical protein